jgi:predicted Co/Zn/Cd cation transporter (cation efflux family)
MKPLYARFLALLDGTVFPFVVRYATHPFTILLTILLLIPLILDASNTTLALILGNYTNVVSASVSSIVLATSLKHHHEAKKLHAQTTAEIARLHEKIDATLPAPRKPRAKRARVEED